MDKLTYTVPADTNHPLAGRTLTGGKPGQRMVDGKMQEVAVFEIDGKTACVRLADKPELAAAVARYREEEIATILRRERAKADHLEAALPGITEILRLSNQVRDDRDRYQDQFSRMMGDEQNDGRRPPRRVNQEAAAKLSELLESNPRAALYLRARDQADSAHWADNTGKGAAGRHCMRLLIDGSTELDECIAALDVRREWVD